MPEEPKLPRANPTTSSGQGHMVHDVYSFDRGDVPLGDRAHRRKVILVLVGLVVVLVAVGGLVWALNQGDPESVDDVASAAVDAAEDFDVDAGIELFCEPLTDEQRDRIDEVIADGREAAGTDEPDVTYEVSNVEGDKEGSFKVIAYSKDGELASGYVVAEVEVGRDGDRSCVSDIDVEGHEGELPTNR